MQVIKKAKRLWRKRRKQVRRLAPALGLFLLLTGTIVYVVTRPPQINQTAYQPLLNTIAKGESNGNYNAYFGEANNTSIKFTDMTVGQVLDWQKNYVQSGSKSSAVGRYQIIRPTLNGLISELQIDSTEKFNKSLQDRLAIALLERRGVYEYVYKDLDRDQFAANLAKEWAALPKMTGPNSTESYYAGDGLNKARIGIPEMRRALDILKANGVEDS